ncbi:MAG: zinc-ribbon domain-containing protein [Eubacterium sp.]|nr:zinc-ribbon domain-containing protein [Eubacterium sp.]
MFCDKCHASVDEDAVFCPKCGNKIIQESNSHKEIIFAAAFGVCAVLLMTALAIGNGIAKRHAKGEIEKWKQQYEQQDDSDYFDDYDYDDDYDDDDYDYDDDDEKDSEDSGTASEFQF